MELLSQISHYTWFKKEKERKKIFLNIFWTCQSDSAVNRLSANSAGLIAVPYDNRCVLQTHSSHAKAAENNEINFCVQEREAVWPEWQ